MGLREVDTALVQTGTGLLYSLFLWYVFIA